jgi:hypothetical protein
MRMFSAKQEEDTNIEEAEIVIDGVEEEEEDFEHFTQQIDEESFQNWLNRGFT